MKNVSRRNFKLNSAERRGNEEWLEITTEMNAIDYLERAADFIQWPDAYKWKWVSISLHASLYAFAICALRGTDPDRVTSGPDRARSASKLIGFQEALKRCQREEWMQQYADSKCLQLSKDERESIRKIVVTRNSFMHYSPKSWWIRTSVMLPLVKHCSRVMRFLSLESGNVRLLEHRNRYRITKALAILENADG